MKTRFKRRKDFYFLLLGAIFISFLLGYHFFENIKFPKYPWWHEKGNDGDGSYVAQTLALLNDGDLVLLDHPGGTLYMLYGLTLRTLCPFNKNACDFQKLALVPDLETASNLLDRATQASRIFTFALMIIFLWVLLSVLFQLCKIPAIALLISFFYFTSSAVLQYFFMIRPEIISLLSCSAGLMVVLSLRGKDLDHWPEWLGKGGLVGVFFGLALFAKIQVLPLILAVFLYMLTLIGIRKGRVKTSRIWTWAGLALACCNFIFFPWWSVDRPDIVSDAYLAQFPADYPRRMVYGDVPSDLFIVSWPVLTFLFVAAVFLALDQKDRFSRFKIILTQTSMTLTGMFLSIYIVLLPVFTSLKTYKANTNHLTYALLTNLLYGAFAKSSGNTGEMLQHIFKLHQGQSRLLGINILFFVVFAITGSLLRISFAKTENKKFYYGVLAFFCLGFLMDITATQYMPRGWIYEYYALYSLLCHCLGLGLWAGLEWDAAWGKKHVLKFKHIFVTLMFIHMFFRMISFVTYPKETGISKQYPLQEYVNCRSHAAPFWDMIDRRFNCGLNCKNF